MKILKGGLANNKIDSHGEAMSVEALRAMIRSVGSHWIPVGIEHDPRVPPIGRIADAELVHDPEDGSVSVVGSIELFEEGDFVPLTHPDRRLPRSAPVPSGVRIEFDRSFRDEDSQRLINEISVRLGTQPIEEVKKALEPISVLTIVGMFIATSVASGFFGQIGADIYDSLKQAVKTLLRDRGSVSERLLVLDLWVSFDDRLVEVQIILTNPTSDDIDQVFESGPTQLATYLGLPGILHRNVDRLVFSFADGRVDLEFGVRQDALPLSFRELRKE